MNSQFIVELLDKDLGADPPYLVFELCEHGSLRSWVDARKPWNHVAIALAHIVQGLTQIHQLGGFHRDLKPENLLLHATTLAAIKEDKSLEDIRATWRMDLVDFQQRRERYLIYK